MKENKDIFKQLEQISDKLSKSFDTLDDIQSIDRPYSEILSEIQSQQPNPKLKKKEQKELFHKILNEKMPEFVKVLNEFDLMIEALGDRIEESKDKLQDKMDAIGEIEDLQEELEDKKRELDF